MDRATAARRPYEDSILEVSSVPSQPEEPKNFANGTLGVRDEIFRILARIRPQLSPDDGVLLLTGVTGSEGASELAKGMALALTRLDSRPVLLVDTAISSPSLHERFGIPPSPGLSDVIAGAASLSESVRRVDRQLYVLPAGNTSLGSAELFASPQLAMIMQLLRAEYHFVLLSAPPVLTDVAATLLSSVADGAVLVVSSGSQRRGEALAAQNELRGVNAKMLGVVLYSPEQTVIVRKSAIGASLTDISTPIAKPPKRHDVGAVQQATGAGQYILLAFAALTIGTAASYILPAIKTAGPILETPRALVRPSPAVAAQPQETIPKLHHAPLRPRTNPSSSEDAQRQSVAPAKGTKHIKFQSRSNASPQLGGRVKPTAAPQYRTYAAR